MCRRCLVRRPGRLEADFGLGVIVMWCTVLAKQTVGLEEMWLHGPMCRCARVGERPTRLSRLFSAKEPQESPSLVIRVGPSHRRTELNDDLSKST